MRWRWGEPRRHDGRRLAPREPHRRLAARRRASATHVHLYGFYYDLDLFSNFTYFLDDPVRGDQFEQIGQTRDRWAQGEPDMVRPDLRPKDATTPSACRCGTTTSATASTTPSARNRLSHTRADHVIETSVGAVLRKQDAVGGEIPHRGGGARGDCSTSTCTSNLDANDGDDGRISSPARRLRSSSALGRRRSSI